MDQKSSRTCGWNQILESKLDNLIEKILSIPKFPF